MTIHKKNSLQYKKNLGSFEKMTFFTLKRLMSMKYGPAVLGFFGTLQMEEDIALLALVACLLGADLASSSGITGGSYTGDLRVVLALQLSRPL